MAIDTEAELNHAAGGSAPKQTAPKRKTSGSWEKTLRSGLTDAYSSLSMVVGLLEARNPQTAPYAIGDSVIILQRSEKLVEAWIDLARDNLRVRAILLRFVKGSALAGVLAGHAMLAVALYQHHAGPPQDMAAMFAAAGGKQYDAAAASPGSN